jgi:thioredoxin-related protein
MDNFESEIRLELRPILLACIRRGFESKEQLKVLEQVSSEIDRSVKICIVYEGLSDAYRILSVEGTPTFLLYIDGEEIGRLLGKVAPENLIDFVAEQLGKHMSDLERISFSSPS